MAPAEAARSAAARPRPPPPVLLLAAALALAWALPHAPAARAQSCDPDADATYTAAVLEYSPALGVTLDNAAERFRQNVHNYVAYAKEAKRQGAEIVVFPECGLATLELPRLPDSSPAVALPLPPVGANPCVETDVKHAQELRDLSCAARDAGIYVVVNLPEVERCLPALAFCPECPGFQPRAVRSGIVACNADGRRYFNSDVAFDRKGAVVARYRKYNLFGEAGFVPPAEPTLAYFDADFGVRFGLFTCFDLMFEQPAVTLVTEAGVSDVLFPTAWFSELPFLTAVQAQAAWAWVLDVNFLGAGYNLPEVGSTGTGLYAGRRGKVVATMERERTNKLLVGRLPNRNACSHNATAAAHLAGRIVVLARKADPPAPAPAPVPPPAAAPAQGKCANSLPPTNPKIPSLYQCHLQSLLQLKSLLQDGRRLINPETGEEADEQAGEGVKYELYYQREADEDEAEVRADEAEFREAVAPRRAGDAALLQGARFRRYVQDVMLRGLRRLHAKEPGAEVEVEAEEEDTGPPVDIDQLKADVERLLFPGSDADEKQKIPTLGDTVDTMRNQLEGMVGKQGMEAEGEQFEYLLHRHQEEEERHKLHQLDTPPLNDTLETMGSQFDELGDHTGAQMLHEAMEEELLRERNELEEARRKAVQKCKELHGFDQPCVEHLKAEGLEPEVETKGEFEELEVEELPWEEELPAEGKVELEFEALAVQELQLPDARAEAEGAGAGAEEGLPQGGAAEGALRCQCVRQAEPSVPPPLPPAGEPPAEGEGEGEGAPGVGVGVGVGGRGLAGSADEGGYLYLKTEDLADYVTVLLPAGAPDPAAYENSSLKVCHDSFCCHFQVVMSVQLGEAAGEAAGEGAGAGEGRADEPPFASGQDTEGMGFVRAARRAPVGGALARHFIIPEGEEEDYLEDDEEDEGGDDEDDDEEDEAFAPDPEEMEPTEDAFDDDEEMQMDTSAEFAIDPVLLKASGIGHYGPGQVFKESVEREDMEPSETTIRAQAIADEKQAEELAEMQAHMPGVKAPDAAAPDAAPQEATEEAPEAAPEEATEAAPEAAAASREDQRYYYRVAVFSGRRTFDGITDGGLQVCAVIPCTGVTPDTCGKLHHFPSDLALTAFRHVRISGRFARVRSLPLPSTLDAQLLPLPADAFSLTASVRRKETDIVMETHKPVSFLTFGIYNRNFANDPERQPSIG